MFKNAALLFFVLQVSTATLYAQNSSSSYDEFAKQSGGMVFHLNKDELATDQGAFFSKTIEGQMGGYLLWRAYDISMPRGASFDLPIDSSITYVWIMISTVSSKPQLQIIAPNQTLVSPLITKQGNALVASMPISIPGIWKITVASASKFDIQLQAKSDIYVLSQEVLRYTFGHEGFDYFKYTGALTPGKTEMFEVTIIDPTESLNNLNISVVNMNGMVLESSKGEAARMNEWLHVRAKFKIPKGLFQLMVSGVDKQGNLFVRMGSQTLGMPELKIKSHTGKENP